MLNYTIRKLFLKLYKTEKLCKSVELEEIIRETFKKQTKIKNFKFYF